MKETYEKVQHKLAEGISILLRNMDDKQQRIDTLNAIKQPPAEVLKIVNQIAIEKQDFETCEALKIYSADKGIEL
jgi:hypothetical protein